MRIAVVDIGTNSTRLLIGEQVSKQEPVDMKVIETGLISTRLGEGMGSSRVLSQRAIDRTIEALLTFRSIIDKHGVTKVVAAATSAVRDAANQTEFVNQVKDKSGFDIRVLSGVEEAGASYLGVVRGLKTNLAAPVVIDIGGGSTEFIWHSTNGLKCESLQLGAVRMTESKHGLEEIKLMISDIINTINSIGCTGLIGVGGTVTTLAAIAQKLVKYDPEKVHGYFIGREKVRHILNGLEKMTVEQRMKVPGLQPQRADIIVAGISIALAILDGLDAPGMIVSESDIMHGLLYEALEEM